jgi:hypothetical protein
MASKAESLEQRLCFMLLCVSLEGLREGEAKIKKNNIKYKSENSVCFSDQNVICCEANMKST